MRNFCLIFISVALNAFAQFLLRHGMLKTGDIPLKLEEIWHLIRAVFTNIWLFCAMACYGVSILVWMVVLSKVNVSTAYPLSSIGYIITAALAYFYLNEPLTTQKILGIVIICIGVIVLTYKQNFVP